MATTLRTLSPTSPATGGEAVTPHDSTNLTETSRALWCGVAGNVTAVMEDGQVLLFKNMTVGWHPLRVTRVNDTGTAQGAGDLVAVW